MNKPRKAQGMPLNTIVLAALVLIVLVILVLIFSGRINMFRGGLSACEGTCENSAQCSNENIGIYMKGCTPSSGSAQTGYDYCCSAKVAQG
jgi:hypothetical protein